MTLPTPASIARDRQIGAAIIRGDPYRDIAATFGLSVPSICRIQNSLGLQRPSKSRRGMTLTQERLREVLTYDPASGWFTWRKNRLPALIGERAGSLRESGYRYINLSGRAYPAHRLAWFYVYGRWPGPRTDHRNHDRDDNALTNLREATNSQSSANRHVHRHNSSGIKGVRQTATGLWRAVITVNRRRYDLGRYKTPEEAGAAYDRGAVKYFGEFALLNFPVEAFAPQSGEA